MPRYHKVYLEDILEAIQKIGRYTVGISFEVFSRDEKTIDAVVRNLEVIGEAVKQLPEQIRGQSPKTDWKKIAGLRDLLIHAYFGVDVEIIWDIICNKIDELQTVVKEMANE